MMLYLIIFFINCGVPQGSVLGPLLYLVYVDTMRFYVPGAVNTSFADDTVFSAAARNADDLVEKINQALSRLLIFTRISRLSVNVLKTHFILFSRKGSPVDLNGKIFLCNRPLKQVAVVRYLGFQLDQNLNWKAHSDQVAAKVSRGLGSDSTSEKSVTSFCPFNSLSFYCHALYFLWLCDMDWWILYKF